MDRLSAGSAYPVTFVVAPAGYGKSIAVRHFLARLDAPCVRFDLRPEHATMLGFVRGLAQAFAPIIPDLAKTAADAYERNHLSEALPADLALWMSAHLQGFSGTAAIDDLHLAADPRIAPLLSALIDRTEQSVRWIIASREMPDLRIASRITYGTCGLVIGASDLTLTLEELRAFAGAADVEQIFDLTEGWPAACAFARGISAQTPDFRVAAAATREMIYRYLAEQVYSSLSPEERDILLFSSRLATIDLAALHAAGFDTAFKTLEGLRARVAFIVAEGGGTYRCHDLFREFLERQLALEGNEAAVAMERRAAAAMERIQRFAQAIRHYVKVRADDDIVRLLEAHGFELFDTAYGDVVDLAIDALPANIRMENPTILCLRGLREAGNGRLDDAQRLFDEAIRQAQTPVLRAALSVAAAPAFINSGRDARALLEPYIDADLPRELTAQAVTLLAVAYAIAGQTDEVNLLIVRGIGLIDVIGSKTLQARMLLRLGIAGDAAGLSYEMVKGFYLRAKALAEENGMHATLSRVMGGLSMIVLNAEGTMHHVERYAHEEAASAQKAGDRRGMLDSLIRLGTAACARGDAKEIAMLDAKFSNLCVGDKSRAAYFAPIRASAASWNGDFRRACELLSREDASFYGWDRLFNRSMRAICCIALGERTKALKIAASALGESNNAPTRYLYPRVVVGIATLMCAIVHALAGQATTARVIAAGVSVADGEVLAALRTVAETICRVAKNQAPRSDIDMALAGLRRCEYGGLALTLERVARVCVSDEAKSPDLTLGELTVLRRLDDGFSPKDIAAASGRSVHTVRTLIQRATQKLGCSGRQEALHIARSRGLLKQESPFRCRSEGVQ
jgi:ATP/maltotriose-dependent transcriptional regulator MalT